MEKENTKLVCKENKTIVSQICFVWERMNTPEFLLSKVLEVKNASW